MFKLKTIGHLKNRSSLCKAFLRFVFYICLILASILMFSFMEASNLLMGCWILVELCINIFKCVRYCGERKRLNKKIVNAIKQGTIKNFKW